MTGADNPNPTALFSIRLWQEELAVQCWEWRGSIKNLHTGDVFYFRQLEEIAERMAEMIEAESPSSIQPSSIQSSFVQSKGEEDEEATDST